MNLWHEWWVWAVAGFGLAILEMLVPVYLFLGFGLGAGAVALVLVLWPLTGAEPLGLPVLLVLFAVSSLLGWLMLRRVFGMRHGQVKIWTRDINDN